MDPVAPGAAAPATPTPAPSTPAPVTPPATPAGAPAAAAPATPAPAAASGNPEVAALQAIVDAQKTQIATLAAQAKAAAEAGMTAEQKQAARLAELEAAAAKATRYDALIAKRRDEALARLPEAVRTKLAGAVAGLDADRALELIEAAGLAQTTPPTVGAHERGTPAGTPAMPSREQLESDPDAIMGLPYDQRVALLGTMGIQAGPGVVWRPPALKQ